jgi:diphthine-ammonia ligase
MLQEDGMKLENVIHINAFLASMDDFLAFNQVYASYFGTSPPARACVAVSMPLSQKVVLDVIACRESPSRSKSSLHVQGLSYWAPANIGPYSQAISVRFCH